jgi:glycerol uptake facilitator-like aquaporin
MPYLTAQFLGALVGAALVWLHYLPHWKETPNTTTKGICFKEYRLVSRVFPTFAEA